MAGMYSERLVVRNFGPITNLDIEIRPLTLFIGTQGSGKSTVAKLLTICRNAQWWKLIQDDAESDEVTKPFYYYNISDYFESDSYISYTVGDHHVEYKEGAFTVSLKGDDSEKDVRKILYVLAERNLIGNLSEAIASLWSANIPLSKPMLEYMSQFERATQMFPRYEIPFFGVDYVKKGNKNMIELRDKKKILPMNASSSGLQSAIPMLMIIDYALRSANYDAFVIEEPEQNLFPENQREVLNFIASRLAGGSDRQFVITTHSPYMLSCLNVLMLASKLDVEESVKAEVEIIVPPSSMVNPDSVAAYSLDPNDEDGIYCKSLISEKTGMVSVNALDTASLFIGEDFDRLARLYSKVLKSKK